MAPLPPSNRGWASVRPDLMIDLSRRMAENQYDEKTNPEGIVDLGSALNDLMEDDLAPWVGQQLESLPTSQHLPYNDTQGSPELLSAVAGFMNRHMKAKIPLGAGNILAANGVTTLLNSLAFTIADAGDAVLLPTPSYGMFSHDLCSRNELRLVSVPCDDLGDERFIHSGEGHCPLVRRLEKALKHEKKAAAVLLANPENPLGRAYDSRVLQDVLRFCSTNRLHLIVDEIYAMTAFEKHFSMLSLDLGPNIQNVHVLWGMSKDFGCGGLRLGFLATYNVRLHTAMRTLSMFGWVSAWSAAAATQILRGTQYLHETYLPTLQQRLTDQRDQVLEYLTRLDVPFLAPDAGFFVLIDLSMWADILSPHSRTRTLDVERELLEFMMANGVFLEPGKAFFAAQPGWFRLNYGGRRRAVLLGLERLAACLRLVTLRDSVDDGEGTLYEKTEDGDENRSPKRGHIMTSKLRRWRRGLCFGH